MSDKTEFAITDVTARRGFHGFTPSLVARHRRALPRQPGSMTKDYRRPYREQCLPRKRCCDLLYQPYLLGLEPAPDASSQQVVSPNRKPHLMAAYRTGVDAEVCIGLVW